MRYLRTKLATDWDKKKSLFQRVIETSLFFVKSANPGYEGKMHFVDEWVVEFDEDDNPFREVALDSKGFPVFAGPSDDDYGFWLDTNMKYSDFTGQDIEASEFEKLWVKSGVKVTT